MMMQSPLLAIIHLWSLFLVDFSHHFLKNYPIFCQILFSFLTRMDTFRIQLSYLSFIWVKLDTFRIHSVTFCSEQNKYRPKCIWKRYLYKGSLAKEIYSWFFGVNGIKRTFFSSVSGTRWRNVLDTRKGHARLNDDPTNSSTFLPLFRLA